MRRFVGLSHFTMTALVSCMSANTIGFLPLTSPGIRMSQIQYLTYPGACLLIHVDNSWEVVRSSDCSPASREDSTSLDFMIQMLCAFADFCRACAFEQHILYSFKCIPFKQMFLCWLLTSKTCHRVQFVEKRKIHISATSKIPAPLKNINVFEITWYRMLFFSLILMCYLQRSL